MTGIDYALLHKVAEEAGLDGEVIERLVLSLEELIDTERQKNPTRKINFGQLAEKACAKEIFTNALARTVYKEAVGKYSAERNKENKTKAAQWKVTIDNEHIFVSVSDKFGVKFHFTKTRVRKGGPVVTFITFDKPQCFGENDTTLSVERVLYLAEVRGKSWLRRKRRRKTKSGK